MKNNVYPDLPEYGLPDTDIDTPPGNAPTQANPPDQHSEDEDIGQTPQADQDTDHSSDDDDDNQSSEDDDDDQHPENENQSSEDEDNNQHPEKENQDTEDLNH